MLSICIALKNRSRILAEGRELRLFPNCVGSIVQSLDDRTPAELVVADWDSDDWPLADWLPQAAGTLPVRIVRMEGAFSRGQGLNAAACVARGDALLFTDADCLLCPALVGTGIDYVRQGKAFFPIVYCYDGPDHRHGRWAPHGYGICMLSREAYERTGGWPEYKAWGKEDNDFWSRVSEIVPVARQEVPGFYHQWHPNDTQWKDRYAASPETAEQWRPEEIAEFQQVRSAIAEVARIVPPAQTMVLVDEARFGVYEIDGRRALPFLEHNGEYNGPPADDQSAIRELERMQAAGATYLVFAWMAFWWLEHYVEFARHIRCNFPCVLENDRLKVFHMAGDRGVQG